MSETDYDNTEHMDPSEPTEELAHLIKNAADVQVRILTWRVLDANDFKHLEADVRNLNRDVDAVLTAVDRERERMGL